MELQKDCAVQSGYHTVAVINEAHQVHLVQQQNTRKIYVRKRMEVYNAEVYRCLQQNPVPGVPRIRECYEQQGKLTVIEEYISGDSLEEKLQRGKLTDPEIICWLTELCEILNRLHKLQPPIVHRDIKPSNVMITDQNHVVLLDFNAAKQYHRDSDSDTVLLGTQGYAAPEQYGFGASSPQTDIYAVGVMLREMLKNTPDENQQLAKIADRCTRLSPEERYPDVTALQRALAGTAGYNPERTRPEKHRSFLPPGFRTHTPWKMIAAGAAYLFVFWISLTLKVKDAAGGEVWLDRITLLLMALSAIAGACDYLGIQSLMPLCRNRHRFLRGLGILILDFALMAAFFMLMVILESVLFHR